MNYFSPDYPCPHLLSLSPHEASPTRCAYWVLLPKYRKKMLKLHLFFPTHTQNNSTRTLHTMQTGLAWSPIFGFKRQKSVASDGSQTNTAMPVPFPPAAPTFPSPLPHEASLRYGHWGHLSNQTHVPFPPPTPTFPSPPP